MYQIKYSNEFYIYINISKFNAFIFYHLRSYSFRDDNYYSTYLDFDHPFNFLSKSVLPIYKPIALGILISPRHKNISDEKY